MTRALRITRSPGSAEPNRGGPVPMRAGEAVDGLDGPERFGRRPQVAELDRGRDVLDHAPPDEHRLSSVLRGEIERDLEAMGAGGETGGEDEAGGIPQDLVERLRDCILGATPPGNLGVGAVG